METTRRTSSLPSGVFKACSPDVEAELVDDVAQLFLRHMVTGPAPRDDASGTDVASRPGNRVAPMEVAEFVAALQGRATVEPPDPMERLAIERLWVLADLAATGSPAVRAIAAGEIAGFVRDMNHDDAAATAFLRDVRAAIASDADGQLGALHDVGGSAQRDAGGHDAGATDRGTRP